MPVSTVLLMPVSRPLPSNVKIRQEDALWPQELLIQIILAYQISQFDEPIDTKTMDYGLEDGTIQKSVSNVPLARCRKNTTEAAQRTKTRCVTEDIR